MPYKRDLNGRFIKGSSSKLSEEHKRKIGDANRKSLTGKKLSQKHKDSIKKGMTGSCVDEKNSQWKGENAGYMAIHNWIRRHWGTPRKCEDCGKNEQKRMYHWANISGLYKRDRSDWKRLCVPCHSLMDKK